MNGYIHPNNIKNKNKTLGLLPQTPLHLGGRRGRWQTLSTYPYGECCRLQGVKGKMHGYAALDPSTSVGVAKRSEADGAGNLSRLAKQPLAAWLYRLEATQRPVVRVQEVFPAPLPRGERGCGATPHGVNKPLGGAGECAKGTHLRGYSFIASTAFACKGVVVHLTTTRL